MPVLHGKTYQQAREGFASQNIPSARITTLALHKDVTLPQDHRGWRICDASPNYGATLTATAQITLKLAEKFSDCTTSFHGYLHEKNDPAHSPPKAATSQPKPAYTPQPVKPRTPHPTRAATKPAGSAMVTCPDGKQGYACTSNGHPVVDGQFCPKADRGRTLKATNRTMVTCSYDPSIKPYRWQ
ncbi:hypothetical protein [Streptomyces sp. CA-251247]|uniref:hypothetical protein n=1 Tax=Streptomyces sp. CA-251247 TaxID=3240062 RepID=UPI003D90BF82